MINIDNIILIIFLMVIFESIGHIMLKHYHINNNIWFFIFAIFSYTIVCYFLVKCYNFNNMGNINCIWSGVSIISIILAGLLLFNEEVYKKDIVGIIIVIIGIFIIQYKQ
jgi:small multidrug resistance pump